MEYLVLHSYINLGKQTNKSWRDVFKVLGVKNIILLLVLLLSSSFSIVFGILYTKYSLFFYINMIVEIITVVIILVYTQRENIINSNTDIKRQYERYDEVKKWLEDIGFKEKNQIKQLCHRCEKEILDYKEKDNKRKSYIDKIFNFFLIPFFAALLTWLFGLNNDIQLQLKLAIEIGVIGIVLYIFAHGFLAILAPIIDNDYIQMQKMIKDIQGVLDKNFIIDNEDII